MKKLSLGLLFLTLLFTGCATSIPQAENFPQSKQKKAMAAQHWGWIANDAVAQTKVALAKQDFAKNKPLYVTDGATTDFGRAFRKYMIAGLIDAGFEVSTIRENAIELGYEAQVIKHAAAFDPKAFGYQPGMATAGVAGFWVLRDALRPGPTNGAILGTAALALGVDAYNATNPGETGVEVLVSTSITHQDRYVMLNADAYYIENGEAWLFEGCKGRTRRYCR